MTITMETHDHDKIVVWGPDGHPMGYVWEFDTVTCQLMVVLSKARYNQGTTWKHPLDYVKQATAIKFRPTPKGEVDSIIMTLPGAYATKWEPFVPGSQPNPNAARL